VDPIGGTGIAKLQILSLHNSVMEHGTHFQHQIEMFSKTSKLGKENSKFGAESVLYG